MTTTFTNRPKPGLPVDLTTLCAHIPGEYRLHAPPAEIKINKIATPADADSQTLAFISANHPQKQVLFDATHAGVVICDETVQFDKASCAKGVIMVKDPKLLFARLGQLFFIDKPEHSIHQTAVIHPAAKVAKDVSIGPFTYIGQCEIESGAVIDGHCHLYDNVTLGADVRLHAGCILGAPGCGQIRDEEGVYQPFPHVGGVRIEAGVEIGTHSCIAKGALSQTIIKKNTVIDSFVQIGHNVIVEENVLILANAVIGGSSIIRKNVVIAIGAHICDYLTIEENAHIGPGVVVVNDVPRNAKVLPKLPLTLK